MQAKSLRPVKAFTMGFRESGFDESRQISAVDNHLGVDNKIEYVSQNSVLNFIRKIPDIYDELFADSSAIPTYLLSRLTRQHVTVALSGDGGDELFGGYRRYRSFKCLWACSQFAPQFLQRVLARPWVTLRRARS